MTGLATDKVYTRGMRRKFWIAACLIGLSHVSETLMLVSWYLIKVKITGDRKEVDGVITNSNREPQGCLGSVGAILSGGDLR